MTDSFETKPTRTRQGRAREDASTRGHTPDPRSRRVLRALLARRAARGEDALEGDSLRSTDGGPRSRDGDGPVSREQLEAARRGPVTTLPASVADGLAATFGRHVHDVRIHADSVAASLALALDARAFAMGRDIFFASEQLRPDQPEGAFLLAHEMAHAVRTPGSMPAGPVRVGPEGGAEERTADVLAANAIEGGAWRMLAGERRLAGVDGRLGVETNLGRALPAMASGAHAMVHLTPARTPAPPRVTVRHDPAALEAAQQAGTPEWMKQNVLESYRAAMAEAGTPEFRYAAVERAVWVALGQQPETLSGKARSWLSPLISEQLRTVLKSVRAALNVVRAQGASSDAQVQPVPGADEELTATFAQALQESIRLLANAGTTQKAHEYGVTIWTERLRLGGLQSFPSDDAGLPDIAASLPAAIGQCVLSMARQTASDVELAVTELPTALHVAAMNVVRSRESWIEDAQLPAFVEEVLAQPAGVAYVAEHQDARDALLAQASALRAVGEVMALHQEIWGVSASDETPAGEQQYIVAKSSLPVDLKRWVQGGRDYQVSHYLIPTWRYYEKYIQGYTFLGGSTGKRNGLHSALVARLPTVEATIRRRAAAAGQGVGSFRFYGFRFALHGPAEHAMGRAFDTLPKSNPHVRDPDTIALMGLLSGQEVSSRFQNAYPAINQRQAQFEEEHAAREETVGPLLRAATERVAALEAQRTALNEQLRTSSQLVRAAGARNDSPDVTLAREEVERSRTALEALEAHMTEARGALETAKAQMHAPVDASASRDAAQLARGYDALQRLDRELRAGWNAVASGAGGDVAIIAANITAKIEQKLQEIQTRMSANERERETLQARKLALEARLPTPATIRERTEAHLAALRAAGPLTRAQAEAKRRQFAQTLREEARPIRDAAKVIEDELTKLKPRLLKGQLATLTALRDKLLQPKHQRRLLSTGQDTVAIQSVGQVAQQGLVDLPRWMVEGFVDCGWTWGGAAWGNMGNFDSMHFEYPIRVPGGAI